MIYLAGDEHHSTIEINDGTFVIKKVDTQDGNTIATIVTSDVSTAILSAVRIAGNDSDFGTALEEAIKKNVTSEPEKV